MTMTKVDLPKIIRFGGVTDSGEFGAATCPHCGADGRYVYSFTTTEGQRGAMAGCIKLFPVSPVAEAHRAILDKGRTKELNSWDRDKLITIEQFYAGQIDEALAERALRDINKQRDAWIARKYPRGRR